MGKAVIGGGAVGLLLTAYYTLMGEKVVLYTRRTEQADLLNEKGLMLICDGEQQVVPIKAAPLHKGVSEPFVILAVKQYQLEAALQELQLTTIHNLLFLQNGMGHLPFVENLSDKVDVLLGVVEHGALKHSDHCVEHTGKGQLRISPYQSEASVSEVFSHTPHPYFPIVVEDNWYDMLANKLAANVVINSLTSLYGVKNGELLKRSEFHRNMRMVFEEATNVLHLKNKERTWEQIETICLNTAENTSSMLKDLLEGRRTEIDAILGWLVRQAEDKKIKTPLLSFLNDSIKGMEQRGGQ
ncbi:2-dehydropantoate 2-reductase [Bacillus tianshenii]|nr:2-dehydropantoate 2-reductase [Bacillus tianshenii]